VNASEPSAAVRLFIFSGVPDPNWTLAGEAAQDLLARVREIVRGEPTQAPPPGGLGYRGFLVQSHGATDVPPEFVVFNGVLSAGPEHWRDTAGLEDWLLMDARRHDQGPVLDSFAVGHPHVS
jgi:hypothetical protein